MHQVIAHDLEASNRTTDVILDENISFQTMLLHEKVLNGLTIAGFRKPSPIQLKAIPLGRCGFDLIIKSKSGTGKTAVFSVVALEAVDTTLNNLQVLILGPTREIAVQIHDVIKSIGCEIKGLKVESFIGGLPEKDDFEKATNCHIAVGAPGRVKALLCQGILNLKHIRLFVVDEADKLMESSFQSDINHIYHSMPERKQMIAASATYTDELNQFLKNYMQSPTQVSAESNTPLLLGLKQFVREVNSHTNIVQQMKVKNEELLLLLSQVSFTQCLVFSNYQTRAQSISNTINQSGWNSTYISAAQSQTERLEAVKSLKNFSCRILLSTDLTARGIDAANVDLVINYDVPVDAVTYLHRMGRAGRYGARGICITLVSNGSESVHFQNILGSIGGTSISIPKLLTSSDSAIDLWTADLETFDQLFGTVSDEISSPKIDPQIKNEILELKGPVNVKSKKKTKNKNTQDNLKSKETSATEADCFDSNKVVDKTKKPEDDLSCEDPTDILQSLASGNFDFTNIPEVKAPGILVVDDKKRKREIVTTPRTSIEAKKEKNDSTTSKYNLFCKNRAMYDVAKILTNNSGNIDEETVDHVQEYLKITEETDSNTIKEYLEEYESVPSVELLKTIRLHSEKSCKEPDSERILNSVLHSPTKDKTLENIFCHAYNYATDKGGHWEQYLPENEITQYTELEFQSLNEVKNSGDCNLIIQGNLEELSMDDADESYEDGREVDNQLQWVPVVNSGPVGNKVIEVADVPEHERFSACYNQCSVDLWQNGLCFDTVERFDDWFQHWQKQVESVRNYVSQNIYIKEMSDYQNKFGHK